MSGPAHCGQFYKYNQENALGGAAFYAVNGTWTEATATFTQATASLAILGGDADVDNFIQRVRSNIQDQRAVQRQGGLTRVGAVGHQRRLAGRRDSAGGRGGGGLRGSYSHVGPVIGLSGLSSGRNGRPDQS